MYEIYDIDRGEVIAEIEEPRYVYRNPKNGVWIKCEEQVAECVAINGRRYSIRGKVKVEDAPVVSIRKGDVTAKLKALAQEDISNAESLEEVKAAYADLADALVDLYYNK